MLGISDPWKIRPCSLKSRQRHINQDEANGYSPLRYINMPSNFAPLPWNGRPPDCYPTPNSAQHIDARRELLIFLHGRLEADEHESNISIPDPSELYIDFLSNLYDTLPPNSQILMPAYHEHYKDWKREPRDLTLGPVSSAIGQAIHNHVEEMHEPIKATVISFSMGAAVLLKLLANDPIFFRKKSCVEIQRLILIEPV